MKSHVENKIVFPLLIVLYNHVVDHIGGNLTRPVYPPTLGYPAAIISKTEHKACGTVAGEYTQCIVALGPRSQQRQCIEKIDMMLTIIDHGVDNASAPSLSLHLSQASHLVSDVFVDGAS